MVTVTSVDMNRDGTHDVRVHDEPTAMSFKIPLTGSTIVATAAVVTTCSASAETTLTLRLQRAAGVFASRCRVVVEVSLLMVHTILFGTA